MAKIIAESVRSTTSNINERLRAAARSKLGRRAVGAALGLTVFGSIYGTAAVVDASSPPPKLSAAPLARAVQPELKANCYGEIIGGNTCYYWAGAFQKHDGHFSADGVSAQFSQNDPKVGPTATHIPNHSLVEIWAASADSRQAIEVGWAKSTGDKSPQLFATHWVNGQFKGYASPGKDGNGFVSSGKGLQVGHPVRVGEVGTYGIEHKDDAWEVLYNHDVVGEFPESLWTSRGASFRHVGAVSVYGEISVNPTSMERTQMGDGILGRSNNAASVSDYKLIDSTVPSDLSDYYAPRRNAAHFYSIGDKHATSFTYGGPGYVNSP